MYRQNTSIISALILLMCVVCPAYGARKTYENRCEFDRLKKAEAIARRKTNPGTDELAVTLMFRNLAVTKAALEDPSLSTEHRQELERLKRIELTALVDVLHPYFEATANKISRKGRVVMGQLKFRIPRKPDPDELISESVLALDTLDPAKYYDATRPGSAGLTTYFNGFVGIQAVRLHRKTDANQHLQLNHERDHSGLRSRRTETAELPPLYKEALSRLPPEETQAISMSSSRPGHVDFSTLAARAGVSEAEFLERRRLGYHHLYLKLCEMERTQPEAAELREQMERMGNVHQNSKVGRLFMQHPELLEDLPARLGEFAIDAFIDGHHPLHNPRLNKAKAKSDRVMVMRFIEQKGFKEPDSLYHRLHLLRYHEGPATSDLTSLLEEVENLLPVLKPEQRRLVRTYLIDKKHLEDLAHRRANRMVRDLAQAIETNRQKVARDRTN